jgi:hypothetical protein
LAYTAKIIGAALHHALISEARHTRRTYKYIWQIFFSSLRFAHKQSKHRSANSIGAV